MTSPKVFIEEQLALREQLAERLEVLKNHLANPSSDPKVGSYEDYEDVTEDAVADVEERIAEIDERIERLKVGKGE